MLIYCALRINSCRAEKKGVPVHERWTPILQDHDDEGQLESSQMDGGDKCPWWPSWCRLFNRLNRRVCMTISSPESHFLWWLKLLWGVSIEVDILCQANTRNSNWWWSVSDRSHQNEWFISKFSECWSVLPGTVNTQHTYNASHSDWG